MKKRKLIKLELWTAGLKLHQQEEIGSAPLQSNGALTKKTENLTADLSAH